MTSHLVLDTNILLLEANNLLNLAAEGTIIVLPETVLDELDSKKSGHTEIAYQARQTGRLLSQAQQSDQYSRNGLIVTILHHPKATIHIIALDEYPHYSDSEQSIRNDRKILHSIVRYQKEYIGLPVSFMSNDVMCRIRASSLGIPSTDLRQIESTDVEFTKKVSVSPGQFSQLHNLPISEVDPNYKPENYNYVFTDLLTGQTKLANIQPNGHIDVLGKTTEADLRKQDAPPRNSGQLFLSRAIQNPSIDIVVCESLAGSGKTVTAISNAISLVKRGLYSSIYYIRASVNDSEKQEEIGFLSGNEDKVAVYLHPLEDTLDFIVRSNHKDSKHKGPDYEQLITDKIEKLRARCNIHGMITLGMRGRTFSDAVVIIDEVQNMSNASLVKVLTRFGKNCKIILIGSNRQIDNPFLTKHTNGFSVVLNACRTTHPTVRLHAVELTKVLRSPIAEWAEALFDT